MFHLSQVQLEEVSTAYKSSYESELLDDILLKYTGENKVVLLDKLGRGKTMHCMLYKLEDSFAGTLGLSLTQVLFTRLARLKPMENLVIFNY